MVLARPKNCNDDSVSSITNITAELLLVEEHDDVDRFSSRRRRTNHRLSVNYSPRDDKRNIKRRKSMSPVSTSRRPSSPAKRKQNSMFPGSIRRRSCSPAKREARQLI